MLVIIVMVVVSWFGNGGSVQYRAKIATGRPTICTCIYPTCMLSTSTVPKNAALHIELAIYLSYLKLVALIPTYRMNKNFYSERTV